ncbi:MAG TPA: CBS domain-containing protein [Anaeromyxobacteraceae bacterium]
MLVRNVMKTAIDAFREDDTVKVLAMRMRDVATGFVPVCDRQGHPVGTVSDYDIVRQVCAEDRLASETLAGDIMEREIITCYDDDELAVAEERMNDTHKARILVLDRDQKLAGVITLADVFGAEDDHRAVETARHVVEREYLA